MTWKRWMFDSNAWTHVIPVQLETPIIDDLISRGAVPWDHGAEMRANGYGEDLIRRLESPQRATEAIADIGGPCAIDRPIHSMKWSGISFSIPCEDVTCVLATLRRARVCSIGPFSYYRLATWAQTIIMLPGQYHSLVAKLAIAEPNAIDRQQAFMAERAVRLRSTLGTDATDPLAPSSVATLSASLSN